MAAVALAGALTAAGCSTSGAHHSAPTTTLLQTDDWSPPVVSGSTAAGFCTVLTAMYRHEAKLPVATPATKARILDDFVATVPEAVAAAPAGIAPAARIYLTRLADVLAALSKAGLDWKKVPAGTLTPLLLDPRTKAAGDQVLAYSESVCHYTIGGAPQP